MHARSTAPAIAEDEYFGLNPFRQLVSVQTDQNPVSTRLYTQRRTSRVGSVATMLPSLQKFVLRVDRFFKMATKSDRHITLDCSNFLA